MKIGELAQAAGTQAETIRYYERQGLLPAPLRSAGNYRVYDQAHIQRLAFIRHCRCLDMALDEIRALLQFKDNPGADCAGVDSLLDAHIEHVATRIRELKTLEKELRGLRQQCTEGHAVGDCGIIQGIEKAARQHDHAAKGPAQEAHVAGVHRSVGAAKHKHG
jgi:Cd(II)/Pb(II)-responsive transcriptional regulator